MEGDGRLPDGLELGRVQLRVRDLDRALDFYHGLLGLQVAGEKGEPVTLEAGGRALLSLITEPGLKPKPPRSTGLYHFALLVPDRPALGWALRRLLQADYPLQGAADHWVSEAVYLADPEGNGIEIYRDRQRSEWPMEGGSLQMATDPLMYEDVLREGETGEGSLLHAETRMGHVHLHVSDLPAAEEFYGKTLGFERVMGFGHQAAFYSVAGYHHHIGLNTWAGIGAPKPPDDSAGLDWFEMVLPNASNRAQLENRLASQTLQETSSTSQWCISPDPLMYESKDMFGNAPLLNAGAPIASGGSISRWMPPARSGLPLRLPDFGAGKEGGPGEPEVLAGDHGL
jgi:catechol 2,3-dioxygenase